MNRIVPKNHREISISGEEKKRMKSVVCAGIVTIAILAGAREARATIVEVTEVQIIRGELVGGWFEGIEEVDEVVVADVFTVVIEVSNLGSETEHVLNLYEWDLSPQNRVEVIGTSVPCVAVYNLQPGDSVGLHPFCSSQAFRAEGYGWVTMNIYVKDWVMNTLSEQTFEFEVIPEPSTAALLGMGLVALLSRRKKRGSHH